MNGCEILSDVFSVLIDMIVFLFCCFFVFVFFYSVNMMDYTDRFMNVEVVLYPLNTPLDNGA